MENENEKVEEKKNGLKYFVFKANVPLDDSEEMLEWTKNCQEKTPIGHGDYRWGKILHDHLFVQTFKEELELLKEQQDTMLELLGKIIKSINIKEVNNDKSDELFGK